MKTFTRCLALIMAVSAGVPQLAMAERKFRLPKVPWAKKEEAKQSQYGHPVRMATIWTPDVLTIAGKQPTRGLGGRLYFYNNKNQAVPVEGQLIVYVYDEELQEQATSQRPNRVYAFRPDQFASKFSESNLGASYSVWIPWDVHGASRKKLAVIPVFTSVTGQHLVGQQSVAVLNGPAPPETQQQQQQVAVAPTVAPVAYTPVEGTPVNSPARRALAEQRRRLSTTTIDLSSHTARQLRTEALQNDSAPQHSAVARQPAAPPSPVANRFGSMAAQQRRIQAAPHFPIQNHRLPGQIAQPMQRLPETTTPGQRPLPANAAGQAPTSPTPQVQASRDEPAIHTMSDRLQLAAREARKWPSSQQRQDRFVPYQYQAQASPTSRSATSLAPSGPSPSAPAHHQPSTSPSLFPAR